MTTLIYHYPIDLTGRRETNLVANDPYLITHSSGVQWPVIVLTQGGYYADSLRVYDSERRELSPETDYVGVYTYEDVSVRSGKQVLGGIIITNPSITGSALITAQIVGGGLAFNLQAKEQILQHIRDNPSYTPSWNSIIGEDTVYGPGELERELRDSAGYQLMTEHLEYLANMIAAGDQNFADYFRQQLLVLFEGLYNRTPIDNHIGDTNNPHVLTAAQVNLGNVTDHPVATNPIADTANSNSHYITPAHAHRIINIYATMLLNQHLAKTNPHETTAAQIGAYTTEELDALVDSKLGIDDTAVNADSITQPAVDAAATVEAWDRISRLSLDDITDYGPGPQNKLAGGVRKGIFGTVDLAGSSRIDVEALQPSPSLQTLNLQEGTYSVLLMGGGGGASGNLSSEVPRTAAGGGSGYLTKTRVVIGANDLVQVRVPRGGTHSSGLGTDGERAELWVNGNLVASAAGGKGARYISTGLRAQGGDGGSGGGSGGGAMFYDNGTQVWSVPGNGGANGTDGGGNGQVANGAIAAGPGGSGQGSGYYVDVMTSIDIGEGHGFYANDQVVVGLAGVALGGGTFSNANPDRGSAGGGGGGLGNLPPIRPDRNGQRIGATGYGAGGTCGATSAHGAGQRGFVSMLRIGGGDSGIGSLEPSNLVEGTGYNGPVTAINNTNFGGWLKYTYGGKVLYVARDPIMYGATWNALNQSGLINGSASITITDDGQLAVSNHTLGIAHRPESTLDKVVTPERRGYWNIDFGIVSSDVSTFTISEDDYQALYDDGMVDEEPEVFFSTMDVSTTSANGSLSPNTASGYTINAIMEESTDVYVTSASFVIQIMGHAIPSNWFTRVEIYNGSTLLSTHFRSGSNVPNGSRLTSINNGTAYTQWNWTISRGQVFPTSGTRTIRFITATGTSYSVRTLSGSSVNPAGHNASVDGTINPPQAIGSEWNELFLDPDWSGLPTIRRGLYFPPTSNDLFDITRELNVAGGNTHISRLREGLRSVDVVSQTTTGRGVTSWRAVLERNISRWDFINPLNNSTYATTSFEAAIELDEEYSIRTLSSDLTGEWTGNADEVRYVSRPSSIVGLISNVDARDYTLVVDLSANTSVNNNTRGGLGLCIAKMWNQAEERYDILSVMRQMTGAPLALYLNHRRLDQDPIMTRSSGLSQSGWPTRSNPMRMRVQRSGSQITVQVAESGSSTWVAAAQMSFDLGDYMPSGTADAAYGFMTFDMSGATWRVVESPSDVISYNQTVARIRAGLSAADFTTGRLQPQRMGLNTPTNETLLRGDGRWTTMAAMVAEYGTNQGASYYYIGLRASDSNALSHINSTYSNWNAFPEGTVVFYHIRISSLFGGGNGGAITHNWNTLKAAIRRRNGWAVHIQ